jgi:hypothetical protein
LKTLVCGPYVGEFGWEIFSWSGYCRALSRHFEDTIVITRPGRGFLYTDFAKVQYFTPPDSGVSDCENNSEVTSDAMVEIVKPFFSPTTFWLPPFKNERGAYQHWAQPLYIPTIKGALIPEYIPAFRDPSVKKDKVLLHARDRSHVRVNDNAPISLFVELASHLKNNGWDVASIGASESSHVKGTTDMRNISLNDLSSLMNTAVCTIGPSSGPLHFAALVKCPIIAWSSNIQNSYRYSTSWNPHDTKLVYINIVSRDHQSLHPPVQTLVQAVEWIQEDGLEKMQINNTSLLGIK